LQFYYLIKISVKHVFPFQDKFSKKKTIHRVRKKSKCSILKRWKKAHQKEEGAKSGSTKCKEKEVRRKVMEWQKKAGP
jgi:hypothetical protein